MLLDERLPKEVIGVRPTWSHPTVFVGYTGHMVAPVSVRHSPTPKVRPERFDAHAAEKVEHLIAVYGVNGVAALVGVSPSQPVRWRQGKERPSDTATRQLLGLEYLTSRLSEVFTAPQAQAWLASPNPYLAGSSPAYVFAHFGAAAVEPAISAVEIGAVV